MKKFGGGKLTFAGIEKHKEVFVRWLEDYKDELRVQMRLPNKPDGDWIDTDEPCFDVDLDYRIAPTFVTRVLVKFTDHTRSWFEVHPANTRFDLYYDDDVGYAVIHTFEDQE